MTPGVSGYTGQHSRGVGATDVRGAALWGVEPPSPSQYIKVISHVNPTQNIKKVSWGINRWGYKYEVITNSKSSYAIYF
jgi:hypothetical protein